MPNDTFPNRNDIFHLPLVKGETISFYLNLDNPISSGVDINNLQIDLVECEDAPAVILSNIVTLNKNIVKENGDYHVYAIWDIPTGFVSSESYRLVLFNASDDQLYYISNPLKFMGEGRLLKLEYRDDGDIFEYYYSSMPDGFANVFYLPLNISKPITSEESEGYDKIDNTFERVRMTTRKQRQVITEWFDDDRHDAFVAASLHDTFIIGGLHLKKASDQSYSIDWNQNYPLSDGEIQLDDTYFSETYKQC